VARRAPWGSKSSHRLSIAQPTKSSLDIVAWSRSRRPGLIVAQEVQPWSEPSSFGTGHIRSFAVGSGSPPVTVEGIFTEVSRRLPEHAPPPRVARSGRPNLSPASRSANRGSRPRRSPLAVARALLAGLSATFVLPYFFPVAPTISESYLVGFNNHACLLLFVSFASAFAWWTDGFGLTTTDPEPQASLALPSRRLLYAALVFFFLVTAGAWGLMRSHPAIGESIYFLDRLQHLAAGELPYKQFEFAYGPFLLYLPLATAYLFRLSLADGYYISWIAEFALGILLIYEMCLSSSRAAGAEEHHVSPAYLQLVGWPALIRRELHTLPFLSSAFSLLAGMPPNLLLHRCHTNRSGVARRGSSDSSRLPRASNRLWRGDYTLRSAPVSLFACCSPSAGSWTLCSRVCTSLLGSCRNRPSADSSLHEPWWIQLSPPARHAAHPRDRPSTRSFLRLRLRTPNPALLRARRVPHPARPLMLPAAFGRSDIGHFIINSTGTLMAAWTILSFYPHLWRYAVWSYALLVLFLPAPRILYRAERAWRNNVSTVLLRPDILATKTGPPVSPSLSAAPASLFAPFGLPLANSPKLPSISAQTGFYHGIELVTAPSQIQQKIQELRSTPARDLLLPNSFSCAIRLDRRALRKTLSTLYVPPSRNGTGILEPLCRYIHQHYQPSGFPTELQGFEIWKPRPSTP